MKFISYLENGAEAVGILNEDKVVRLNDILSSRGIPFVGTMTDLICAMEKNTALGETIRAADLPSLPQLPAGSIKILAPIPYPRRNIFCLGKNYAEHAAEVKSTQLSDSVIPKYPIYFSKTAVPAIGSGDPIRFSLRATRKVDYEAELAVVIGRKGRTSRRKRPSSISLAIRSSTMFPPGPAEAARAVVQGKKSGHFLPDGALPGGKERFSLSARTEYTLHGER
jgi:hypothetical protein